MRDRLYRGINNSSFPRLDWLVPLMCYVLGDQITDPDPDHLGQSINNNFQNVSFFYSLTGLIPLCRSSMSVCWLSVSHFLCPFHS